MGHLKSLIQMLFDLDPPVPCEGSQWDYFHVYQQFIFVKSPLNAKNEKNLFQLGQNDVNKSTVHVRKMGHLCTKRDTCAQNGTLFSDTFF